MGLRGFGNQTLLATAQPLIGTTLTAAIFPSPDQATGSLAAGNANSQVVSPVASAANFRKGDRVLLGVAATFSQAATVNSDSGFVQAVDLIGNKLTINGLQRNHASGEFVVLSIQASRVKIQTNASSVYLGGDSTVAAGSSTLAEILLPGQSYDIGPSSPADVYGTGGYWVASASASDTYLPSITTI